MSIYINLHEFLLSSNSSCFWDAMNMNHIDIDITIEDLKQTVGFDPYIMVKGPTFKGRKHTEDTKKKMSKSISIAMKKSPKARTKNQSGALNHMYGKNHSEEAKIKMKEKRKNMIPPALGKTWKKSETSKKKMSDTCKGRFRVYKEDGTWTWGYPKR